MYRTSPVIIENEPLQGEQDTNAQRRCPIGANFPYNYLRSIHYPLHKCAAQPIEVMLILLRLPPKGYANALPLQVVLILGSHLKVMLMLRSALQVMLILGSNLKVMLILCPTLQVMLILGSTPKGYANALPYR